MDKNAVNHNLINQILRLKTIQELIEKDDLPMSNEEVLIEIEKSLQEIKMLYTSLLS